MSATVEPVDMFQANCWECSAGSGLYLSATAAEQWAAEHDAENHAEDDGTDDAYEKFKESRK